MNSLFRYVLTTFAWCIRDGIFSSVASRTRGRDVIHPHFWPQHCTFTFFLATFHTNVIRLFANWGFVSVFITLRNHGPGYRTGGFFVWCRIKGLIMLLFELCDLMIAVWYNYCPLVIILIKSTKPDFSAVLIYGMIFAWKLKTIAEKKCQELMYILLHLLLLTSALLCVILRCIS